MAETDRGYRNPGDVEIRTMTLVTSQGQSIDIGSLVIEFNIYQDLFSHYMRCEAVINDSTGLLETLQGAEGSAGGFTGGETLVVSYKTKDDDLEFNNHAFGLFEMANRQRVQEKNEVFLVQGISIEFYNNVGKKISRAYGGRSGNQISTMIESILRENFLTPDIRAIYRSLKDASGVRVTKENKVDNTNGLQRFVIPNMTIDDTIDFFAREADCDGHVPFYIFYENQVGYQFRDINTLLMDAEPKQTYTYEPSNYKDTPDESADAEFRDPFKISEYNVARQGNFIDSVQSGLFSSKTHNIDLLRKTFSTSVFKYENSVSKFNSLQSTPIAGTSGEDSVINMTTSRIGHDSDPFFRNERVLPKRLNQFISLKTAFFKHNFNTKLEITVPGDSTVTVGDVIYVKIPVATNLDDQDGQEDKYLSGKYIIARLRHKMAGKTGEYYSTHMELAKSTGNR